MFLSASRPRAASFGSLDSLQERLTPFNSRVQCYAGCVCVSVPLSCSRQVLNTDEPAVGGNSELCIVQTAGARVGPIDLAASVDDHSCS